MDISEFLPFLAAVYLHLPELVLSASTTGCGKYDIRFQREGQPGYQYEQLCSDICTPGRNPEYEILCWSNKHVMEHCGDYVRCINPKPIPEPSINNFNTYGVPLLIVAAVVVIVGIAIVVGYRAGVISKIRQRCRHDPRDRNVAVDDTAIEDREEMNNLMQDKQDQQQNGKVIVNGQTARHVRMVEPRQNDTGELAPIRQHSPETKPKTVEYD
ncbi:unnamed protein product [Owenia fusiformis]|uniref:Uncharacterized protein n=1 Tax=Owenia fusiformis TaxID=6347 RepID=A0A8J1TEQ7_OWEFU|nr:unnamed protein product [Owenia fusiformis]